MIDFAANMPPVGVHRTTPFPVYSAWSAVSNSQLTKFHRSPAHLRAALESPRPDTKALLVGRSVHTSVLEPDAFEASFTVADRCAALKKDGERCSNTGIVENAALGWLCGVHVKGAPGSDTPRHVLSPTDFDVCRNVRDAVLRHPSARRLLVGDGDAELSIVWDDRESGVRCRGRIDRYRPLLAGGTIIDVKTSRDASPRAFAKAIYEHGYHRQGAMYIDGARAAGLDAAHFVLVAVEKEAPFAVACYRLLDDALDLGRVQLRSALARFRECVEADEWPAYGDDILNIGVPEWAARQAYADLAPELEEVA